MHSLKIALSRLSQGDSIIIQIVVFMHPIITVTRPVVTHTGPIPSTTEKSQHQPDNRRFDMNKNASKLN